MNFVFKKSGKQTEQRLNKLISRARAKLSLNEDGKLTGELFSFNQVVPLFSLYIAEQHGRPVPHMRDCIHAAIKCAITDDTLKARGFLSECNKQLALQARRRTLKYTIWSDLSLTPTTRPQSKRYKIDDVWVSVGTNLPHRLKNAPVDELIFSSNYRRPKVRTFVWATCHDVDENSAGHRMTNAIDFLIRLIEFQYKISGPYQLFRNPIEPINAVTSGPSYFLYCDNEKKWSPTVWMSEQYDFEYWERRKQSFNDLIQIDHIARKHLRSIINSPFEERLRKALDHLQGSWRAALANDRATQLWKVVESLFSNRNQNTDTNTLIKRCVHWADDAEQKWLIEQHLRLVNELRNSSVHADASIEHEDPSQYSLQLTNRWLVECYRVLLSIDKKIVRNDSMYLDLLDLDATEKQLVGRLDIIEYELKRRQRADSAS